MTNFADKVKAIYRRANDLSGGSLDILRETFQRFNDARASEAAAGMAYYALFSLFPLLLALVAAGSFFLESERAYREVVDLVTQAIPVSRGLIERNIRRVLELRGTVGIVGLIGLLWSATGVFTILANHINRAWPEAETRNFLEKRLVALGMVGVLAGLLVLSLFSTAVLNLLPRLQVPLWGGVSIYETSLWAIVSKLVPGLFISLMFLSLYRWVPNTEVKWSGAVWAALVAAFAWEAVASAVTWYLSSGLARYELVYGSLGAVVALMFWIYISSLITLFGAYLSAAINRHT
jgi:membrane protein